MGCSSTVRDLDRKVMRTWLHQPHVKNFLDLRVIGGDVEDAVGRVLYAGDVDGHQVLRHLLPLDRTAGRVDMEHLRPEPETI